MSNYTQTRAQELSILIRENLKHLPDVCAEFIQSIDSTTQPLTRYAYTCDLKVFCEYLLAELPSFSHRNSPSELTIDDFRSINARQLRGYLEYLNYYIKDGSEYKNTELGKLRKLSSLRSFFSFLYKNEYIQSDVSRLIDMPKRHEKPIIRLEIDEVARMLDYVESGENLSEHQRKYNEHTRLRDLTILTLFLGTGIRVSELVGLNVDDLDFETNGFLVTRKGGNQMILYMPDEVSETLKAYLKERSKAIPQQGHEKALFLSLQGRRMSVRAVQMMVKKYASAAAPLKKHLSPHKLRSTYGTNLYHETGDIYLVADVLGHSDVNTTKRHYAAMSDDRRRYAAKRVKLREDFNDESTSNDASASQSPTGKGS